MKVIKEQECNELVRKSLLQFPNQKNINIFPIWLKIKPYVIMIILLLSSILSIKTFRHYKDDILFYLGIENLNILYRFLVALLGCLFVVLIIIIMIVMHEAVHCIGNLGSIENCYIVLSKSITVSIFYDGWNKKQNELITLALPFIIFEIIAFLLYMISRNIYLFLWISLINFAISSSDILAFFVIMIKVPNGCLINGHYYRHQ